MRNLRDIRSLIARWPEDSLPLTGTAWDDANDALICIFGPSEAHALIELRRFKSPEEEQSLIATWESQCAHPDIPVDKVLRVSYFVDELRSCVVFAGGDIVTVRDKPLPGQDQVEIVGSVDAGISAATWSPDEELLAVSTLENTLLLMTRDFENVTSIALKPEDLSISRNVSVGWGKSETQFKGKRAKALRDPTVPERVDEGVLSQCDDAVANLSWRGDGAYVAINSIDEGRRRTIRVYSRDGTLESVSEPVDGLEGTISWRPAGNLIAGLQRRHDRADVVFFERNGLRHGESSLRLTAKELESWGESISLTWNSDSTVLAIAFTDRVQLWTMGNYHYYLKQEIVIPSENDQGTSVKVSWHPERPLHAALRRDKALQLQEYGFAINSSSTLPPNDIGLVSVIDGSNLKLTPLRLANVPPPMALHDVQLPTNVVDVAVNSTSTGLVVLLRDGVRLYDYNAFTKGTVTQAFAERFMVSLGKIFVPRQVIFRGDSSVFILASQPASSKVTVIHVEEGSQEVTVGNANSVGGISTLVSSSDRSRAYLQVGTGLLFELSAHTSIDGRPEIVFTEVGRLPFFAPLIEEVELEGERIFFGLAANGTLYALRLGTWSEARIILRNCTSFSITAAHLIVTTASHLLKFVHMTHVDALEVPADEPEKDERCRSIERGARIVAVMPTAYSVTLQMPRGNLETIYPRALVLAGIRKAIMEKDYKSAFLACRNHRVDMNILHDHSPHMFMQNVDLVISQLEKVEYIDLFLSQLKEEDVSQTRYKETRKVNQPEGDGMTSTSVSMHGLANHSGAASKLNRICDAFLRSLSGRGPEYLQSVITAHMCKSPPDIDGGLLVVARNSEEDDELAERAVEHICFLGDVNRLYDHALGLYNLQLALLVAQQSQKDPKEYLPHLQGLQQLTPLRRKFAIDDQLGRRKSCVKHLYDLDAFDELAAYVEKHELYADALALYRYRSNELNTIMGLYAHYLHRKSRFKEAAISYEHLANYASASEAYRAAHMWRESLSCAALVPLSLSELESLALLLVENLIEAKDYQAAATIQLDYLESLDEAVRLLCKGFFFSEAIRVAIVRGHPQLVESHVDPGLVEGSATMTELLAECKGQLGAQLPRIRELRQRKAEDPVSFYGNGEFSSTADIPDNISLAPSDTSTAGNTLFTRYTHNTDRTLATNVTHKTSKNRRREERKRARGKKGSVYEEEYLVASVARLVERVNDIGDEVRRLVEGLMRRRMRERAIAVQSSMLDLASLCKAAVEEVYGVVRSGHADEPVDDATTEEKGLSGGDAVLQESMAELERKKEPPNVKNFEELAL